MVIDDRNIDQFDTIWNEHYGKVFATCMRYVRHIETAEDLTQDVFETAFSHWMKKGVPTYPSSWLMKVATYKAIDNLRRTKKFNQKYEVLKTEYLVKQSFASQIEQDADVGNDMLRLMFMSCHPSLSKESQVALTLKYVCGLTTHDIASAYLTSEVTISQRLVRAKKKIQRLSIPFHLPDPENDDQHLSSVLQTIYLMFNEGYLNSSGYQLIRHDLCHESMRLGRDLSVWRPGHAEVESLNALMCFQASRLSTRFNREGEMVLLEHQDRSEWDRKLIDQGLSHLSCAMQVTKTPGSIMYQALIAAQHAQATHYAYTDWATIIKLYDGLYELTGSLVVALNRTVAISMVHGPDVALEQIRQIEQTERLRHYHLLYSVKGNLLHRLERYDEASRAFQHASTLTENERERVFLTRQDQANQLNGKER
jgi:RNA polymerase sigma factor (sigma-70 family)